MESWGPPQHNPDPAFSAPTNSTPTPLGRALHGVQNSNLQLNTEQE